MAALVNIAQAENKMALFQQGVGKIYFTEPQLTTLVIHVILPQTNCIMTTNSTISNADKVLAFFEGLSSRNEELAARYISTDYYTEHNFRSDDGVAGVRAYTRALSPEDNIRVIRIFEDGNYVVTQADGQVGDQITFFDVFRFQDGFIVEHWTFSAPAGPPNQSGHTQVDGPTEAKDVEDTEKNKEFLRNYYENFHIRGDREHNSDYFTSHHMARHEPGARDGLEAFLSDVQVLMQHRSIDRIKLLLGYGDFVFVAAEGTHEHEPCLYIDLYRVEKLKVAEHWGFPEMVPPASKAKNGNGLV